MEQPENNRPPATSTPLPGGAWARLRYLTAFAVYYGFARWLPSSAKPYALGARALRARCARVLLLECGVAVNIEHGADFGSGRNLRLGDRSGVGVHAQISGPVEIGAAVMMGPRVAIFARNHQFADRTIPMIDQGFGEPKRVVIEDDVWIGAGVTILPGRTIGRGSILGAGAVVGIDVPPFSIVAGNPAVVVGTRR